MRATFHVAGWLAGLVAALSLLAGCIVGPGSQSNGITVRVSDDKIPLNTPERMCGASLVVDAQIAALGPGHWNTPDGSRPPGDAKTISESPYAIYTPLRLSAPHTYLDQRKQPTSTKEFDVIGGTVGADRYIEEDAPHVAVGQRYLLIFIPGPDLPTHTYTEAWLYLTEAFPIDAQGIVTLQGAHTEEGQNNQIENFPAVTMPLSQIVQQLANCPAG
ncbi:MAG TPA: hypothetical protein VH590_07430 [Ktedonobacterales bacterium]